MIEKNTKIIATVSDRNCATELIAALYKEGMNCVRINTAHASLDGADNVIANVRKVSNNVAIMIDTKGPEVRVSKVEGEGFEIKSGDRIEVRGTQNPALTTSPQNGLYLSDPDIHKAITRLGTSILIDDGEIELQVVERRDDGVLVCEVINGGTIHSRKSVNVPGVHIELPSLTDADVAYINWAIDNDIDFIAHSFVRNRKDLEDIQRILDSRNSKIKIIAKIENQQGVDNIEEILDHCYGVMVARGDLGVELPAEKIPIAQRKLVACCIRRKKPVIIATQMLHSMIKNPRPTRAEVSDIANAIYQRVDAIMLSGETANGKYPIEAVRTMSNIAKAIEQEVEPIIDTDLVNINNEVAAQLSRSAVRASTNLPIEAIIADTMSGKTARNLSAFRGAKPVYTLCYHKNVMRELSISYGIFAQYSAPITGQVAHDRFAHELIVELERSGKLNASDLVVVIGGSYGASQGASYVEIAKVSELINKSLID